MPRPNAKGKAAILIIAALIFVVIGFVCGQMAKALNTLPGNADDPVATQSYVETTVGERLADLATRIEELEAEVATLKGGSAAANPGTTTDPGTTTSPNTSTTNTTLTITGSTVNVRSGPGTDYAKVASVSKGDKVTNLGAEGDWYKVQVGNVTGYISSAYAQ
ncbi:MAG TPA: SH3 domain-containing protein [Candidatus Avidehalobacter gallistercoris]|uniref:SH3 domain-containing protein n=1 Tax=Candidatus Avidehalobacter gallistercoris TaxID=2840694 RepID=A0A9D1KYB9_9FIRM|nr:SH3 domain-containing protein [Candidatus Avidehalobacter gallistercoris]